MHSSVNISQFGVGMKQGKKPASSEILDVVNSRNFCKEVPVPHLLVPVPRWKKWQ